MTQQTFRIPDMHCSNCVMLLEGLEDDLEGVKRAQGSYKHQTLTIEYDEARLSSEQIIAAIRQLGYTVA
jgi:copper chaperone CopZ